MKKKVYIIDDDLDFLELAGYILGKDYEVVTAGSLDVAEIISLQPDLILMDHSIGFSNSVETIDRLLFSIPGFNIPIILVSGHHDLGRLAQHDSVCGFIQKPASIHEIRGYLADFLSKEINTTT